MARELRSLAPDLEIDWLAQHPVTRVLEAEGERIHAESEHLAAGRATSSPSRPSTTARASTPDGWPRCSSTSPYAHIAILTCVQREIPRLKADFFRTLGHPVRIRVLELLAEGDSTVTGLLQRLPVEQPYLSQQLGVLRRAGVVSARRDGSNVVYGLSDPRVAELLAVSRQILLDMATATRNGLRAS